MGEQPQTQPAQRHDQDALLQQQRNVLEQKRPHTGQFFISDRPVYRDGKQVETKNPYNGVISSPDGERRQVGLNFPRNGNGSFISGFAQPPRGQGFAAGAQDKARQKSGPVAFDGIQIGGKPLSMLPGQVKMWLDQTGDAQFAATGYYLCRDTGVLTRVFAKDKSNERTQALGGFTVEWNPDLAKERAAIAAVFEEAGLLDDQGGDPLQPLDDEIPF